jgi:predicted transcriptional regulator
MLSTDLLAAIMLTAAVILVLFLLWFFPSYVLPALRKKKIDDGITRNTIANFVVLSSIAGILLISVIIIYSTDERVNERAQLVFNAVLPLLATWVGVILAFFFSKDNLEASNKVVESLRDRITSPAPVPPALAEAFMTPRDRLVLSSNPPSTDLEEIVKRLQDVGAEHLPILNDADILQRLARIDDLERFLEERREQHSVKAPVALQEFLDTGNARFADSVGFVKRDSPLAKVRNELVRTPQGSVVFVTDDGMPTSPIVGMITRTDIIKKLPL